MTHGSTDTLDGSFVHCSGLDGTGLVHQMKFESWPPPDGWHEVVITWSTMLDHADYAPGVIEQWCLDNVKRRWHLHGYQQTEGFAFRFEDAQEACLFALRWGHDQ